jgi:hypothetical protein
VRVDERREDAADGGHAIHEGLDYFAR